jgi:hypothetical protein
MDSQEFQTIRTFGVARRDCHTGEDLRAEIATGRGKSPFLAWPTANAG